MPKSRGTKKEKQRLCRLLWGNKRIGYSPCELQTTKNTYFPKLILNPWPWINRVRYDDLASARCTAHACLNVTG